MTVVQVNSILKSNETDPVVIFGLITSAFFVAEGISYLSYIKDVNEESRRTGYLFYGFVPLSGVGLYVVRTAMFLLSFCQLSSKSVQVAILIHLGGKTMAIFVICIETFLFLLYKVLRRDFRYRYKIYGMHGWLYSFFLRVGIKIIVDFTGMLHGRHPLEMGGLYFFFNMVWTQLSLFGILAVRDNFEAPQDDKSDGNEELWIRSNRLWVLALILLGLWTLAICLLFKFSVKSYRATFISSQTGPQFNRARFNTGEDEVMITIFKDHKSYYKDYETEIILWIEESWQTWHSDHPKWLTKVVLDSIPRIYIPTFGAEEVGVGCRVSDAWGDRLDVEPFVIDEDEEF